MCFGQLMLLMRILKWNRPRTVKWANNMLLKLMYLQPCTGYIMLREKLINLCLSFPIQKNTSSSEGRHALFSWNSFIRRQRGKYNPVQMFGLGIKNKHHMLLKDGLWYYFGWCSRKKPKELSSPKTSGVMLTMPENNLAYFQFARKEKVQ